MPQQDTLAQQLAAAAAREAKVTELRERLGCTIAHARVLIQDQEDRA